MLKELEGLEQAVALVREKKPLVLNLTNSVTQDFIANSLLALGASPIMSQDIREIEELTAISGAVNINIGTLDEAFDQRALQACTMAQKYNKPVILDPVGVGASAVRNDLARLVLEFASIVRGNASEIMALHAQSKIQITKGVDSLHQVTDAVQAARTLASPEKKIIAVSGAEDFITDGTQEVYLPYGSPFMPQVTGMGCALTSVIAAFRAAIDDPYKATVYATTYFGMTGQQAEKNAAGPGSFRVNFIDALANPNWNELRNL